MSIKSTYSGDSGTIRLTYPGGRIVELSGATLHRDPSAVCQHLREYVRETVKQAGHEAISNVMSEALGSMNSENLQIVD